MFAKKSLLLLLITGIAACHSNVQKSDSLLWKISGNGLKEPSYLFGTFHTIPSDFMKEVNDFDKVLKAVQQVVLEMDEKEKGNSAIQKQAMLPSGITYKDLLSDEHWNLLDSVIQSYMNVSLAQINLKPGYLDYALSLAYAQKETGVEVAPEEGVDFYILQVAKKKSYPILGLETWSDRERWELQKVLGMESDEQLSVQAQKLISGIKILNSPLLKEFMDLELQTVSAYYAQKLFQLAVINQEKDLFSKQYAAELGLTDTMDIDRRNEVMFKTRNLFWMEKIPMLIQHKPTLIAVGALHLTGENGLISLLQKNGYIVEPI